MKNFTTSKTKQTLLLVVLCFFIGFCLSITIRTNLLATQQSGNNQNKNLIEVITNLEAETEALENQVADMREKISTTQQEYGTNAEMVARLQKELDSLKFLAGQTEVVGSGIILTLSDNVSGAEAAKAVDPENFYPENYIVHDTDLRYLLNDASFLAEGISINNQRIVSTSDIRCVGTVIMVNSTRLAPPYEVRLIGSPSLLEASIISSDQYIYLKEKGMPLKIVTDDNVVLPSYNGSIPSSYTQVDHEKPDEASDTESENTTE